MQFTIIGNPENRRVTAFCETVQRLGYSAHVIAYEEWLLGKVDPAAIRGSMVKIDSPGENDVVRQLFIARGLQGDTDDDSLRPSVHADHGIIQDMRPWYAGYSSWLQEMESTIQQYSPAGIMNAPADIALHFDKARCQNWLQQQGVPVAFRLPAITGYDDLLEKMLQYGLSKVFIKPAHASSASGIIAFRKAGHRVQAVTSTEMVTDQEGLRLYNSLKVRTYTHEQDIAALVDRMAQENIFAEEWLPKAVLHDRFLDLRVLVIDGKARHTVIRTSNHIITNLHLGNRRGDLQEFIQCMGEETLLAIHQEAEKAAACFPDSLYVGVDVLLTANRRKIVVLETNAFGDLLPGLTDAGETCYEAQISAMIRKHQPVLC